MRRFRVDWIGKRRYTPDNSVCEGIVSAKIKEQLSLVGLDATKVDIESELRLRAEATGRPLSPPVLSRMMNRIESTHALMSEPNSDSEDISYIHSGLCATGSGLPHARPASNDTIWMRKNGRFSVLVQPGAITNQKTGEPERVGVPYGSKARLIMIHLQTEGRINPIVNLGPSLASFLRSLGVSTSGGPRGSATMVKEQALRIARCNFTIEYNENLMDGSKRTVVSDTRIVSGLEMLQRNGDGEWNGVVELSPEFHRHLTEHSVPLSKRGIAMLAGNSFGLDLYSLFAYRLRKLSKPLHLNWRSIQDHIGADYSENQAISRRTKQVLPDVRLAYPEAQVDVTPHGLILKPSKPPVPEKTMVQGHAFPVIEGQMA